MASSRPRRKQIHAAIEALRELADAFDRRRAALAREVGLTVESWRALEEIATAHFVPSMFALRRKSSAAAVSKILRQLEATGLIRSTIAKHDARGRAFHLTAKGSARRAKLRGARFRAIDAIWTTLDARDVAGFAAFAAKLVARIARFESENSPPRRIGVREKNRRG